MIRQKSRGLGLSGHCTVREGTSLESPSTLRKMLENYHSGVRLFVEGQKSGFVKVSGLLLFYSSNYSTLTMRGNLNLRAAIYIYIYIYICLF